MLVVHYQPGKPESGNSTQHPHSQAENPIAHEKFEVKRNNNRSFLLDSVIKLKIIKSAAYESKIT